MAMERTIPCVLLQCFIIGSLAKDTFILDDMSKTDVAEFSVGTVHEGTYRPCMEDAYAGQFHHDWAENKGNAHLTYHFDPPEDGCYRLEEYHPGSDPACSRYLPKNAKLHVEYCVGKSADLRFNQAKNGAQWNLIGDFPFYKGHVGRFTMSNSADEMCDMVSCFWVADALRLSRIGDLCPLNISGPDVRHDGAMMGTGASTGASAPKSARVRTRDTERFEGTLRLSVRADNADVDVQARLEAHSDDVETALSLHYGGVEVDVLEVLPVSNQRRLTGSSTMAATFDIHFRVPGGTAEACVACPSLQERLQQGFHDATAGLTVESSTVSWREKDPVEEEECSSKTTCIPLWIVCTVSSFLILTACSLTYMTSQCRKTTKTDANVGGKPEEADPESMQIENDEKGSNEGMRDDASTATPTSDENKSLGDVEPETSEHLADNGLTAQQVHERVIVV